MNEVRMAHPSDLLLGVGEIWPNITRNLGPQDLYSLSDAHPYWSIMLERRRPNFLLQLCLPLITDLNLQDLLTLRLVSKAWKQVVDHYLQHQRYEKEPFMNEKEHFHADLSLCNWRRDTFFASLRSEVLLIDPLVNPDINFNELVTGWLDSIEATPLPSANPILSGHGIFHVVSWDDELQRETVDIVTRCLRAHGRHLLRCKFMMTLQRDGGMIMEQEYSQLRDWLNLVPNLISLEVDYFWSRPIHNEVELATHIQENPLPELPNLSKLTVEKLPAPLLQAMVGKYSQVQTLELDIAGLGEYRWDPVHMENLKTLKLKCGINGKLASFQQLLTESWLVRLDTLEMCVDGFGIAQQAMTWGVLIDFLNSNFGTAGKLVKVGLRMPALRNHDPEGRTRLFKDSQACRFRLPQVEQLKLVASDLFLMDFLLPMRQSLKKLAISYNNHVRALKECQQVIQWNGWLGRSLLNSNFWEAFPQLNFVRVQLTNAYGWTYRRREGRAPILIHGKELSYEENVDWEEMANGNGDADADD